MKALSQWWSEETVERPRKTKMTVSLAIEITWEVGDKSGRYHLDEVIYPGESLVGHILLDVLLHYSAAEDDPEKGRNSLVFLGFQAILRKI